MIAKCPRCNLVRISGMQQTCPHCRSTLGRPTVGELRQLGEQAMNRARAARCLIESCGSQREADAMKLAAFMAIFEGRHMSRAEAEAALKPEPVF